MLGQVGSPALGSSRGFTLIEALVSIAILGIVLAIAVPSLFDWIVIQRVKAAAAEMLTDVKFARGEAVKRNVRVAMSFQAPAGQTCYAVHTQYLNALGPCECTKGAGRSCDLSVNEFSDALVELKTVSLPTSTGVKISANRSIRFSAATGIPEANAISFQVDIDGQNDRMLRVMANAAGRAHVCAPAGSRIGGYPPCG